MRLDPIVFNFQGTPYWRCIAARRPGSSTRHSRRKDTHRPHRLNTLRHSRSMLARARDKDKDKDKARLW